MKTTLKELSKDLNLTYAKIYLGVSFITDCKFWQTEYEGVYLTDYNLHFNPDTEMEKANTMKDGYATLFYRKRRYFKETKITVQLLYNIDFMKKFIKEFYESTEKYLDEIEVQKEWRKWIEENNKEATVKIEL